MKIRHATADFHGDLLIITGSSELCLSQLIQELTCGHNRNIPIELQIQSTKAGIQR